MQPLLAEIRTDVALRDERCAARRTLRLEVAASWPQAAARALVHNLSETGLLIETSADLQVGEALQVELPHAGTTTAIIVWQRGQLVGCEFVSPVSTAAVSAALLVAPIQSKEPPATLPAVAPEPSLDRLADEQDAGAARIVVIISLLLSLFVAVALTVALLSFPFST